MWRSNGQESLYSIYFPQNIHTDILLQLSEFALNNLYLKNWHSNCNENEMKEIKLISLIRNLKLPVRYPTPTRYRIDLSVCNVTFVDEGETSRLDQRQIALSSGHGRSSLRGRLSVATPIWFNTYIILIPSINLYNTSSLGLKDCVYW